MVEHWPETFPIEERVDVARPPDVVWAALTDSATRSPWWPDVTLEPSPGSRFEARERDGDAERVARGDVLYVVPNRLLELTWTEEGWPVPTHVELRVDAAEEGSTVRLRHVGWDRLPDGERLSATRRVAWRAHLDALRAHLSGSRSQ